MKKLAVVFLSLLFIICTGFAACSCNPSPDVPDIPAAENGVIQLSVSKKTLLVGETFELKVSGTNGADLTFSSDAESVATVDKTGVITAVAVGKATITVRAANQSRNCYITVDPDTRVPVLYVNNVEKKDGAYLLPLGVNDAYTLDITVLFGGKEVVGNISYRSTDETMVSVDADGVITAGAVRGTAIVEIIASIDGRFADELFTEIKVEVTDVFWSFSLSDNEPLYSVAEFNGITYKNAVEFYATLKVGNAEYNENQLTVTAGEGGYVEVSGNVITAKKAGQTYIMLSYNDGVEVYEKSQRITVERIIVDMTDGYDLIGYLEKDGDEIQSLTLPCISDTINNFSIEGCEINVSHTAGTNVVTFAKSDIADLTESVELLCSFDNEIGTFNTKVYCADYVLRTADDITNKLRKTEFYDNSENGGREYDYYSFVLANDIEGGTISNHPGSWFNKYDGVIDGRGHMLKNLTIDGSGENYGLINTVAANGAVIKNIAFVDMISPRTFITHTASGITLENVFVSGVAGWGELFSVLKGDGATLNNVILKNNGGDPYSINGESIYDEDGGGTLTKNNYIKVTDNFFTTYADGLGEAWDDSGFTIESDGLYFNGTMILANS